ncbi:hypothetical protein G7Y89_g2874 [Cudoniella acicularis]|uniref:Uncharacterized protein n=1 Tax=Cudoniella acicularis TaxID=354080 RepID=A0A8H4W5R0_9HELO|nr:hypothetical protein G7Y89_g2874 [Cudoniella acicularis]
MDFSGCLHDKSLGPLIQGCRSDFKFTIKFEQIFFSIVPAAVFIALCLPRMVYLVRRPPVVDSTFLRCAKLVAISVYAALQLSLLVLGSVKAGKFGAFFVTSTALTFVSTLFMFGVSYLEHSRRRRPSILLIVFLSFTLLLDVAQAGTLWLASTRIDEIIFVRLFTFAITIKLVLILLESQRKSKWALWDTTRHSPKETSSLFDLGALVWLYRLFFIGYRKTLTLDDLLPLGRNMASEALQAKLADNFQLDHRLGQKHRLAKALAKSLAFPLLLPIGPRIAMAAFQFCQPFLINSLLDYLQQLKGGNSSNSANGLIGATILVYAGIATSGALYWYFQERAMYMARGALASAVYRKVINSKLSAGDDTAALTLMSADIERIIMGCLNLHEFWANAIQVVLSCWLLSLKLGAAAATPFVVIICCVICSAFLSKLNGPRQKAWMEKIQKRVGLTANVIGQMKYLKMSGLAAPVEKSIQNMRIDELKSASRFRTVMTIAAVIANIPLSISPIIAFAFASRTLNITTVFTSISYILLLATPLSMLFQMIPTFLAAFTCLGRIQEFLEKESRFDYRKSVPTCPSDNQGQNVGEKGDLAAISAPMIKISEGGFGWQADKLYLADSKLEIPSSQLTMVIGPVASGKSTLCKALLGEAPVAHGQIFMGHYSGRIGYCDQTPYLSNATIQENILGFAPFNRKRYNDVLEATMLKPDLDLLPLGNETKVGSNGITLSGGQKQRISIARALYLDSNLLIFDDILSGQDADTEEQIFRHVFSPSGLLRRRKTTVVLFTHAVRHLRSADKIVALGSNGSLVEQGTFQDLLANNKYVSSLGVEVLNNAHTEVSIKPTGAALSTRPQPPRFPTEKPVAPNDEEEQGRMMGDVKVYHHYFSRLPKTPLAAFIVLCAGLGFFSNFPTIWLKIWSEDITSTNSQHSNTFYLGIYAIFQLSKLACILFTCLICYNILIRVSGARLHNEALSTVINAPLSFFTSTDIGILANLFSQDLNLIDGELPLAFVNFTQKCFICLAMAIVIATSSPFLVITYPFLAIVIYGIQKIYLRTSRQIRLLDLEAKSPLYTHFIDTINGVATFRAFGWVQEGIDLSNRLLDDSQRAAYFMAMIQRWLHFTLQLVVAALAATVVSLAVHLPSNSGFIGASLVTLMTFSTTLSALVRAYTNVETSLGAVSRLKTFSENVKPENLPGEGLAPPPEWPLSGGIQIKSVSASYRNIEHKSSRVSTCSIDSNTANLQHLALKDLHLSIAPGEKVAICGRSGSGKSSIILLLLGLLDPLVSCSANITIDDTLLRRIDRSILRQRIIAVPQDPVFLPDGTSFRSNLDAFAMSTEVECRSVLETVGLWKFVDCQGGLMAGMFADTLSQGQKQLFSLARAVLRRRVRSQMGSGGGILLLDEVSSSVDRDTDTAMHNIIRVEFKEYTIVMISHRLDIVMDFDTVVVMDEGRVVEKGQPRALVSKEESRFGELWRLGNKGSVCREVMCERLGPSFIYYFLPTDKSNSTTDDETDSLFDESNNDTNNTNITEPLYNESDSNTNDVAWASNNEGQWFPEYYLAREVPNSPMV